jgi:hypothetical protein
MSLITEEEIVESIGRAREKFLSLDTDSQDRFFQAALMSLITGNPADLARILASLDRMILFVLASQAWLAMQSGQPVPETELKHPDEQEISR